MADANPDPSDKKTVEVFDSFEDARDAQRQAHLAMTPLERLALVEKLRAAAFPYESRPSFQGTIEIIQ